MSNWRTRPAYLLIQPSVYSASSELEFLHRIEILTVDSDLVRLLAEANAACANTDGTQHHKWEESSLFLLQIHSEEDIWNMTCGDDEGEIELISQEPGVHFDKKFGKHNDAQNSFRIYSIF